MKKYILEWREWTQGIFKKDATFITRKNILHYIIINVLSVQLKCVNLHGKKMYKFYIKLVWNLSIFTLNIFFFFYRHISVKLMITKCDSVTFKKMYLWQRWDDCERGQWHWATAGQNKAEGLIMRDYTFQLFLKTRGRELFGLCWQQFP